MPAANLTFSPGDDLRTITCLFCHQQQEVARRAMSITCRHCHKPLKLEDMSIAKYEARRQIATCGAIAVEKNGNVIAESIKCGGLVVRGRLKGAVESQGVVRVGPKAELKGDVTAPSLTVDAGAVLEGQYDIGPKSEA